MAKYRTSNKSKKTQQIVRQVEAKTVETAAELVAGYVKSWAKTEINRIVGLNHVPVIIPLKNGYKVNSQTVLKQSNDTWRLNNVNNELIHVFFDRRSAVIYSILSQQKKYTVADEIQLKDSRVNKLYTDFQHYESSMRRASKKKNYSAIDVLASRYYDTQEMLYYAKNDLEKTLRLNKYLKVWETGKPL